MVRAAAEAHSRPAVLQTAVHRSSAEAQEAQERHQAAATPDRCQEEGEAPGEALQAAQGPQARSWCGPNIDMAKSSTDPEVVTIEQTQFDGGIQSDPRAVTKNGCTICTNFDIYTQPKQLIPYRDSESGDSAAATSNKQAFEIGYWASNTDYRLFSLGVQSGNAKAEILMKTLTTGGSGDLGDAGWLTPANNQSPAGSTSFNLFKFYKTTGKIYGAQGGGQIWSFDPTGGGAWQNSEQAISYKRIAQGVVHSLDDILYVPYDNKIATNNNSVWNATALTIPTQYYISSIAEFGIYLAIFCAPVNSIGNSRMFLWDRNSSNTTLAESVDWGDGAVMCGSEYEGYLIGISIVGNNSTRAQSKLIIKYYDSTKSTGALPIITLISDISNNLVTLLSTVQKADNRLYFCASIQINGTVREGVWSVGLSGKSFVISHERTPMNDTPLGAGGALKGFFIVGDFFFISSITGAGTWQLAKTNDQQSYTATSIYETFIFNLGDPSFSKDLVGVTVMTQPLPNGASATSRFMRDGDSSFTAIAYEADANSVSKSAVNQEINSDAALPKDHKELKLRLESTGGAVITGFSFQEEVYNKRPY